MLAMLVGSGDSPALAPGADVIPVGQMPWLGMIDFYPIQAEESIRGIMAMDWTQLIPGHPGEDGRCGTKQDAQDQLTFLQDASGAVKAEAQQGRGWVRRSAVHAAPLLRALG